MAMCVKVHDLHAAGQQRELVDWLVAGGPHFRSADHHPWRRSRPELSDAASGERTEFVTNLLRTLATDDNPLVLDSLGRRIVSRQTPNESPMSGTMTSEVRHC